MRPSSGQSGGFLNLRPNGRRCPTRPRPTQKALSLMRKPLSNRPGPWKNRSLNNSMTLALSFTVSSAKRTHWPRGSKLWTLAVRSAETSDNITSHRGVKGTVAELLSITSGFETAIARALGALADALVVSSRQDAYELSAGVSGQDAHLTLVVDETSPALETLELEGLTPATDVVSGPEGVSRLLARVFIAESLDEVKRYWVGAHGFTR